MFPFCSLPKAGSRLAGLRILTASAQGRNSSARGRRRGSAVPNYLGRTKMTVMSVLQIACVMLMFATTTGVI